MNRVISKAFHLCSVAVKFPEFISKWCTSYLLITSKIYFTSFQSIRFFKFVKQKSGSCFSRTVSRLNALYLSDPTFQPMRQPWIFWSRQTFQGETEGVPKTLHRWVPPICHQPALQLDMQPLFICKPEGILTVTVFGKSLKNQLGLQKWNTLIPGTFAHAMALNVKRVKGFWQSISPDSKP